jgi:hypothetical protein
MYRQPTIRDSRTVLSPGKKSNVDPKGKLPSAYLTCTRAFTLGYVLRSPDLKTCQRLRWIISRVYASCSQAYDKRTIAQVQKVPPVAKSGSRSAFLCVLQHLLDPAIGHPIGQTRVHTASLSICSARARQTRESRI